MDFSPLYQALQKINIPHRSINPTRRAKLLQGRQPKARSINFGKGLVFCKGITEYKWNSIYPEVYDLIKQYAPPNFKYSAITLNKNVQAKPHIDKYNKGDCVFVSFGDFEGGELIIEDGRIAKKGEYIQFNGSKLKHYTTPFTGTRYSLIFRN